MASVSIEIIWRQNTETSWRIFDQRPSNSPNVPPRLPSQGGPDPARNLHLLMPPKRVRASPLTSPSPRKRKRWTQGIQAASPATRASSVTPRWTQLALDLGQSDISATKCSQCGMVYAPGADDEAHDKFHRAAERNAALKLTPSAIRAAGTPVRVSRFGAALYVLDNDSLPAMTARKAAAEALGANASAPTTEKAVLAVINSRIVGYCAFERIDQAEVCAVRASDAAVFKVGKRPIGRALCGVRLIWVNDAFRRQGVGVAMLDVARRSSAYAHVYHRSSVAFTAPTQAGARFAAKYAPMKVKLSSKGSTTTSQVSSASSSTASNTTSTDTADEQRTDKRVLAYILVYNAPLQPSSSSETASGSADNSPSKC